MLLFTGGLCDDLLLCGNCGLLVVVLLGMLWFVGLAVGYRFTVVVYLLLLMVSWYCRLVAARLVVDSWVYSFTDCVVFLGCLFCVCLIIVVFELCV